MNSQIDFLFIINYFITMNTFQANYCSQNTECTKCYNKISLLLKNCLESTKGSENCHELYKPHLCYPTDGCSVCINKILKDLSHCKKYSTINKAICKFNIKDCDEECKS